MLARVGIGCLMLVFVYGLQAQNLVPNPGFEEYYNCPAIPNLTFNQVLYWQPKGLGQIPCCIEDQYGHPDFFHECGDSLAHVPDNPLGYQLAFEGQGYGGLVIANFPTLPYREFMRVKLKEPLKNNKYYCAELQWSYAEKSSSKCNKIGMVITTDDFLLDNEMNSGFPSAQVYTDEVTNDTINWNHLSGNFMAVGGEEWLTIGWFFPKSEITFTGPYNVPGCYLYIDAVNVYLCDTLFLEESIVLPQLVTPNNDGKNDVYFIEGLLPHTKVWVYNRWGNEVYYTENYQNDWAGTWNGNRLPSGTYFIQVLMPMGTRKTTYIELMY